MTVNRIGAWVDRRGVGSEWRKWLGVASELGLTDVSLCVHGQDAGKPFAPFQPAAKVAEICRAYAAAGIRAHIMFWPQPRASHANAVLSYLQAVADIAGSALTSAELDVEEHWTRSAYRLVFGSSVAKLYRTRWPSGLPLVVNGITAALPKYLPLVAIADWLIPQAYTAENALSLAFEAAASRVDEVRYWSLAELAGGPDATFVAARCQELSK